jgi:hypothetical protein
VTLRIVPLTRDQANDLVSRWHRHHQPVTGYRFAIGAQSKFGDLVGAAIVGRPIGFRNPQYQWCEVLRCVTNGHPNACSKLYAASARIAREMGFERIQTFILDVETGVSLKAAGWEFDQWSGGGDWNRVGRIGRRLDQPLGRKQRWKKELNRVYRGDLFDPIF